MQRFFNKKKKREREVSFGGGDLFFEIKKLQG